MCCSPPGFSVLHYLLKFAQVHVHWVSDAIQPVHPLMRYIIHTAVLISFTILYITPLVITYLITGSLYLLANFIQFPLSQHFHPASGEHKPNLFFWGCYLFLKYNWHTTLCSFLVYRVVIKYFYIFQNDHRKSESWATFCHHGQMLNSTDYVPHIVLFMPLPHLFVTAGLFLLISIPYFFHPPPTLTTTCLFFVSMTLFICFVF